LVQVGRSFYPCTFTVLEKNDMDFLFGLDMLKRHQCVIDLKRGVLQLGKGHTHIQCSSNACHTGRGRGRSREDELIDAFVFSVGTAGDSVPFLGEADLPKAARGTYEGEEATPMGKHHCGTPCKQANSSSELRMCLCADDSKPPAVTGAEASGAGQGGQGRSTRFFSRRSCGQLWVCDFK
jgi:hypothetical protein